MLCTTPHNIHVHICGSQFDAKTLTNLVNIMHKQERLIEGALGISASRLAQYCKPISSAFMARLETQRPRTIEAFSQAWYGHANARPTRYDSSRYAILNLNSFFYRRSIEVRAFEGSLHAGEVKSYVQFSLALAAKALRASSTSSKRRAVDAAGTKYQMRVFLLGLGMVGDEFKTARHHLTKRLAGSTAWKGERRDRSARAPQVTATRNDEPADGTSAAA
ncbi:MAG: amidoligase family protein [Polyangiales bacterium]